MEFPKCTFKRFTILLPCEGVGGYGVEGGSGCGVVWKGVVGVFVLQTSSHHHKVLDPTEVFTTPKSF